ncbi:hypothetical protein MWU60_08665 [Yoonia sp. F2084L]|uniref:hypothetical protein n=1 Tax=Yoonia sp. F2084L TaxID=2926419 RepID=UPI001FF5CE24|nr:hypothetical protein [Yoonia sp. F2084L]MCK0095640.1 hypothetical protein [Yoonia sp. F2084L]
MANSGELSWSDLVLRGWRFALVVFGLVLAGILLILVGLPMPRATITGFAESDTIDLRTTASTVLNDIAGRDITIAFEGRIAVTGGQVIEDAEGLLRFTSVTGAANITGLTVPENTSFKLTTIPGANRLSIQLVGPPIQFRISPGSDTSLRSDIDACAEVGCGEDLSLQPLDFVSNDGSVVLLTVDLPSFPFQIAETISVSDLRFWQPVQTAGGVRSDSGLSGGHLRFLIAPTTYTRFEPGEIIHFDTLGLGLRSLVVAPEGLSVRFSGEVSDLEGEISNKRFSMMPRILEWFSAQPALRVALGLVSFAFAAGFGLRRSL